MYRHNFARHPAPTQHNDETNSCLTLNTSNARLALANLLDLTAHEIYSEYGRQLHRLTFKSGEVVTVEAGLHHVTVRGTGVAGYDVAPPPSTTTFIGDPARTYQR